MTLSYTQLSAWLGEFLWPFLRIGAVFAVAPVFSARMVPVRVRVLLAVVLSWMLIPLIPEPPAVEPVSAAGILMAAQQIMIGLTMGFVLQLVFAGLAFAGEAVAMSMGLGFASMMDPQNGTQVPVVSSYYVIVATLLFLALNGHLILIGLLADSFRTLPVGGGVEREILWTLVVWAGHLFSGGLLVALPAVTSMLLVNLAFGVVTRAAPQLNIFAVGFPVALFIGFILLFYTVPGIAPRFESLLSAGFGVIKGIAGG